MIPIAIDFATFNTLSESEKLLRLKLLYLILSKKLPPIFKTFPIRLKPTVHNNIELEEMIDGRLQKMAYQVTIEQPIFLLEEDGQIYYAVKARKGEVNAVIGEPGTFGKAMQLYAFLYVDIPNQILKYVFNDDVFLAKVVILTTDAENGENEFKSIRLEASYNELVYGAKKPIFSVGHHVFKTAYNNIKKEVVKAYQIMLRLQKITVKELLNGWLTNPPSYKERLTTAASVALATYQHHRRGIILRDFKIDNILHHAELKKSYCTDMGLAIHQDASESERKLGQGTPIFSDPFLYLSKYCSDLSWAVNQSVDIYPLIITLLMIITPGCSKENDCVSSDFNHIWGQGKQFREQTFWGIADTVNHEDNKYEACQKHYPKVSLAGIDQLNELSAEEKAQLKSLFTAGLYAPHDKKPSAENIFCVINTIAERYGASLEIKTERPFPEIGKEKSSSKPKLMIFLGTLCFLVGLIGAGLIFTGIFSLIGIGLLGVSGIGLTGLFVRGVYSCCKQSFKQESLPYRDYKIIESVDDPIYKPVIENSYKIIQEYPDLKSMIGYQGAVEKFDELRKAENEQAKQYAKTRAKYYSSAAVEYYMPPSYQY